MTNWATISMTLLVALLLTLLPMPDWTIWLRPAWILLVLIYWAMMTPYHVGVGVAWITGIMLDLSTGTMLGEHAFALTVIIYMVSRLSIRLRMQPLLQQGATIFICVLLYQFIIFCIQGFVGALPDSHLYWLSSMTSVLLWPWLFVLMRDCRRWFKVA